MKKLSTALLLFIISLQVFSQTDLSYSGPAKLLVNNFPLQLKTATESLDKGFFISVESKITTMERLIANIKKKDPSFNTSNMEQELSGIKSRLNTDKTAAAEKLKNNTKQLHANIEAGQKLDKLEASGISQADADELLSIDISTIDMQQYEELLEERSISVKETDLPTLKSRIMNTPIIQETLIWYEKFIDQKRLWATATKLMPKSTSISTTYQKFVALDAELGGIENVKAKAKERYQVRLKTMKMPPAAIKDAAIEQVFRTAFIDDHKNAKGTKTILKINLTDAGWTTLYNKLTGIVMARRRSAAIAFKENETGECVLYREFQIIQEYTGSGFGRAKGTSNTAETILCENIQ